MVGHKHSGESRRGSKSPVDSAGYNWNDSFAPPQMPSHEKRESYDSEEVNEGKRIMADGGERVSDDESLNEGYTQIFDPKVISEEVAARASDSEYEVDVYGFGDNQVAIEGDKQEVHRFVGEIRQQLGEYEGTFQEGEEVPEAGGDVEYHETGSETYDPASTMRDVSHENPNSEFDATGKMYRENGGERRSAASDGGRPKQELVEGVSVYLE